MERAIRVGSAGLLVLLAWGYGWEGVVRIGALVLGAAALATGLAGFCPADAGLAKLDGGKVSSGRLLRDARLGFVWLAARLWLAWVWLDAGWEKITDSAWVGADAPDAIHCFLANAASPEMTSGPRAPVSTC